MSNPGPLPDLETARSIASHHLGSAVASCTRFPTGLRNWVYDVTGTAGDQIVVRLCDPRHRTELQGCVHWSGRLRQLGVPIAEVLAHDLESAQPYVVLERLRGTDLGHVIDTLDADARRALAGEVDAAQRHTAMLGPGPGFGYSTDGHTGLVPRWVDVIGAEVEQWAAMIEQAAVVDPSWGDRGRATLAAIADRLAAIQPTPFLPDATTKNVIVADGRLTGIVDVDMLCFGDPLWAVALTRMSLLAAGHPADYAEHLAASLDLSHLDTYTALHGIGFLAEIGQRFNRPGTEPEVDHDQRLHLEAVVDELLSR